MKSTDYILYYWRQSRLNLGASSAPQTLRTIVLRYSMIALIVTLSLMAQMGTKTQATLGRIDRGSLSIAYDGLDFADVNSTNMGTTAGRDFMRYGRFSEPAETVEGPSFTPKASQEFRPLTIAGLGLGPGGARQPNFRDNRATPNPLYPPTSPTTGLGVNGSGPVANSEGSIQLSTDLTFDSDKVRGTVNGTVKTNRVSSW